MTKYITCKCGHEMEAPKDTIKGCYYRPLTLTCPECKRTGCWDWSKPSTPMDDDQGEKEQVTEHTPTPWEMRQSTAPKHEDCLIFVRGDGPDLLHIAETFQYQNHDHHEANGTSMANANFIVTACNSHDALLEACKNLLPLAEKTWVDGCVCTELPEDPNILVQCDKCKEAMATVRAAKAAIKKAEGEA